jgi:hypothetical protein
VWRYGCGKKVGEGGEVEVMFKNKSNLLENEMNKKGQSEISAIAVFGVVGAILGAVFPVFGSNTVVLGLVIGIIVGFLIGNR